MMKSLCYIILFCCCCALGWAQEEGVKPPVYPEYKQYTDSSGIPYSVRREVVARYQINALKKGGVLLVRLKANSIVVEQLRKKGNADLAAQMEREAMLENKAIVKGFRAAFHFCPVYFFMSNYSDTLLHGKLDQVVFLNDSLEPDSTIKVKTDFYLVAEKGPIYNSNLDILPYSQALKAKETGTATKNVAIVVKNKLFQQLHAPFPYYNKGYDMKKYAKYVMDFDAKLQRYYEANNGFSLPNPKLAEYLY